ncbi:MAG: RNA-binding cell elongation regulator Jag/EloR [Eubacteriales bacterium]
MSETYLITAKTVEEAIAIANREYADADHEVSYEIIDMPKKGFLGIGAKDAKIKITVTKSQSVELGSLVADIRSMKSITNRGGESERREKKNPQPQQKKQAQPSAGAKNPQQNNKNETKSENKAETKTESKNEQKPAQTAQKQPRPKQEQKAESKPANKTESRTEPKTENRNVPKTDAKPKQQNPANAKTENKPESVQKPQPKKTEKVEKAEKTEVKEAAAADVQLPEEKKHEEKYSSSLGNQVKQKSRRGETVKKTPVQNEIPSSGVTVSAPVGLSDFVGGEKSGFGSDNYESGKISNDVKKKPKITDPAKANMDALKALTAPVPDAAPEKNAETKKNNPKDSPKDAQKDTPKESQRDSEKRRNKKSAQPQKAEKTAPESKQDTKPETKQESKPEEKKLREAVTQEEMDCALEFANTLLENMKLDARAYPAEADEGEEFVINGDANVCPKINIKGEDTGILIGHHGETLDSIQYLVNLSALRKSKQKDGDYVRIVVDIEGYREKREETLRALARRMAARAVKYKRNIFLEPMNAYERRIIHSELQSFENVSTHSVGADRDRKIIITYEGPDKRERPDRRSEGRSDAGSGAEKTSENTGKRRNKPAKLPIDKLTDLLDSREDTAADEVVADEVAIVEEAVIEIPEEIIGEVSEESADYAEAVDAVDADEVVNADESDGKKDESDE